MARVLKWEITCERCGAPHRVARSDARQCAKCRLLRRLMHTSSKFRRPRRCRACPRTFRPLHDRDLSLCGPCGEVVDDRPIDYVCVRCSRPTPGVEGVALCLSCVKHPDHQAEILNGLRRGQRERKKTHAAELAGLARGELHIRPL